MNAFLKARCELLEKIQMSKDRSEKVSFKSINSRSYSSTDQNSTLATKLNCYYCNENHAIYNCQSFEQLSAERRVAEAKKIKLCLNCLRKNHFTWQCKQRKCATCHKPDHTLLHINNYGVQLNQNENKTAAIVAAEETRARDAEEGTVRNTETTQAGNATVAGAFTDLLQVLGTHKNKNW